MTEITYWFWFGELTGLSLGIIIGILIGLKISEYLKEVKK